MGSLGALQAWFLSHCDGDWEHQCGVRIETLDNPGWSLTINLEGTGLTDKPFAEVARGVGVDARPNDNDWLDCRVADGTFEGRGGPTSLEEMLSIFLKWAEWAAP